MKKNRLLVTFLTIVTLIVSLTACGQKENTPVDINIPVVENNSLDDITSNENTVEIPEVTPTENIDETVPGDTTENQEVIDENNSDVDFGDTTDTQDVVEIPDNDKTDTDNSTVDTEVTPMENPNNDANNDVTGDTTDTQDVVENSGNDVTENSGNDATESDIIIPEENTIVDKEETLEDQPSGKIVVIEATLENVAGFWAEKPGINLNEYDGMPDDNDPILVILDNGSYNIFTQKDILGMLYLWVEDVRYGSLQSLIKTDGSDSLTYKCYYFDDRSSIHNGNYYDSLKDYICEINSVEGNPDLPPVESFEFVTVEALSDGTIQYTKETEAGVVVKILYRAEY